MMPKPFRLLDLPPELWSRICRLAAAYEDPRVLDGNLMRFDFARRVAQPAITKVCGAIRDESLPAFYASPFLYCLDGLKFPLRLSEWSYRLTASRRSMLRNLTIRSTGQLEAREVKIVESYLANLERDGLAIVSKSTASGGRYRTYRLAYGDPKALSGQQRCS